MSETRLMKAWHVDGVMSIGPSCLMCFHFVALLQSASPARDSLRFCLPYGEGTTVECCTSLTQAEMQEASIGSPVS